MAGLRLSAVDVLFHLIFITLSSLGELGLEPGKPRELILRNTTNKMEIPSHS